MAIPPKARPPRRNKRDPKPEVTVVDTQMVRRAVGAAALGNAMEWFDFGVYAYIAVTLGKVFFPSADPGVQLIATFAAFTVAFLVRPIGGLVFGPLGDKIGRQKVLAATMILMAAGTFCIGLIPSYEQIGITAPILLLVARLVQGFSTGGEYGGATTFIAEYSTDRQRGFMGSWLEFGTLAGYSLGAVIVITLSAVLSQDALLSWGWRVPFLVAGPLGLIGLYIRLKLEETPAFKAFADKAEQEGRESQDGLMSLLTKHRRAMLLCIGLVLIFNVTNYMVLSYLPSYLTATLGYDESHGVLLILAVMLIMMVVITFAGRLSDRIGRRPVLMAGCIGYLLLSIPCFMLLGMGGILPVFLGALVLGLLQVCFAGAMPSTLPALFPTHIRYGALAIGFNISVSLFGGTTPLVAAWLVEETGNPLMPAFYLMGAAVIGFITVWLTRETAGRPLRGSPPAVATKEEAAAVSEKMMAAADEKAAA